MNSLRIAFMLSCVSLQVTSFADWPAWRGPDGMGVSTEADLPTQWNANENVRWRVALPEPGNSTPIVSGDRIFVTQPVGSRRMLMCFDRNAGTLLWQQGVETKEAEPTHATNPYCSASPVTDGNVVIASFASDGLYGYDFAGNELWRRTDLGRQFHIWGGGSSPVIHGELCFLNFGPGEVTYLLAVDKKTGATKWKHEEPSQYVDDASATTTDVDKAKRKRDTFVGSWTTPTLIRTDDKVQLLMCWPGRLAAYDPQTGEELWTCSGLNPLIYTSPIVSEVIIVAMGGFSGSTIAVRAGGTGDISESHRVWMHPKTSQRIGSGVIKDGYIYVHNDPGIAECFELATGKLIWKERLSGKAAKGTNWSSLMLAGDHCYSINQGGECFVFEASPTFKLVSVNPLEERSNSSIVSSHGNLFIRTHEALWCIGRDDQP
jgi:outer membrane protein assembly factor BamB